MFSFFLKLILAFICINVNNLVTMADDSMSKAQEQEGLTRLNKLIDAVKSKTFKATSICADRNAFFCGYFKSKCNANFYVGSFTLEQYCPKSCDQCCEDLVSGCSQWKQQGYCTYMLSNGDFVYDYCEYTCNMCGDANVTSAPTTAAVTTAKTTAKTTAATTRTTAKTTAASTVTTAKTTAATTRTTAKTTAAVTVTTAKTTAATTAKLTTVSNAGGTAPNCNYGYFSDGTTCEVCGRSFFATNAKIVGGTIAVANSWPSQVYLQFTFSGNIRFSDGYTELVDDSFMCGGTLLNRNTVLTAAHCLSETVDYVRTSGPNAGSTVSVTVAPTDLQPTIASMFTIYLGIHDLNNLKSGVERKVSRVDKHEAYNSKIIVNDILLLRLITPVVLNNNIQPACLPDSALATYPTTGTIAYGVGWGTTTLNGATSQYLRNVALGVLASSACSYYPASEVNWSKQICAGISAGGKDTCQGDSGGSLFTKEVINSETRHVSSGIVSYGEGCALAGKPGIYTRNVYYLSWIKSKMFAA